MTKADDSERELGGDDALAAEYVLGVLPDDERWAAARRIETEPDFARLVDAWEVRLSPMAGAYAPVEPPASVKAALDRRLAGSAASPAPTPSLWSSLALWRGLAFGAIAALAVAIAIPALTPPAPAPAPDVPRFVASLSADGSDVRYVAVYDAATHGVSLSHLAGEREAGRDFELWVIEGDAPPRSLGVIPVGQTAHLGVPAEASAKIQQGAVFAISLEPAGGSPTGAPTGPVVAAGDLRGI